MPGSRRSVTARLLDQISMLLSVVVIALLLRSLVVEPYYVPSESMLPSLLIGDHMLLNRFVYGARIPFTEIQLPALREPKRGDVVTFDLGRKGSLKVCPVDRCPDDPREGFVKRIVGLPGDTIEVRKGGVILNGAALEVEYDGEIQVDDEGERLWVGIENLAGCRHPILDHPSRSGLSQVRITVPEGRYFMMGDNRDNSSDSRAWGTVRRVDLKGPVMFIYWSWNNRGSWASMLNPMTWWRLLRDETRWDRVGAGVNCLTR